MPTRDVLREHGGRAGAVVVLVGLGASIAALAVAPAVMPPGYSWVSQTTSESAAQGVPGAWVARLGFVLFGLSVILLAYRMRGRSRWRVLDIVAVAASAAIPLGMSMWPAVDGVIQRLMFAIAYLWYAAEAISTIRERASAKTGVDLPRVTPKP